jgi:hypothetical protein
MKRSDFEQAAEDLEQNNVISRIWKNILSFFSDRTTKNSEAKCFKILAERREYMQSTRRSYLIARSAFCLMTDFTF